MFSEWLQTQMEAKELTQERLALVMECSQQTVSHWVTGRRLPGRANAQRLAEVFEVSIEEVLDAIRESPSTRAVEDVSAPEPEAGPERVRRVERRIEQLGIAVASLRERIEALEGQP